MTGIVRRRQAPRVFARGRPRGCSRRRCEYPDVHSCDVQGQQIGRHQHPQDPQRFAHSKIRCVRNSGGACAVNPQLAPAFAARPLPSVHSKLLTLRMTAGGPQAQGKTTGLGPSCLGVASDARRRGGWRPQFEDSLPVRRGVVCPCCPRARPLLRATRLPRLIVAAARCLNLSRASPRRTACMQISLLGGYFRSTIRLGHPTLPFGQKVAKPRPLPAWWWAAAVGMAAQKQCQHQHRPWSWDCCSSARIIWRSVSSVSRISCLHQGPSTSDHAGGFGGLPTFGGSGSPPSSADSFARS